MISPRGREGYSSRYLYNPRYNFVFEFFFFLVRSVVVVVVRGAVQNGNERFSV